MNTKKKSSTGDRKLMDRLSPDPSFGRLLGVLATSYEMQPEFLETDFLPTVLGLGAWDDRNWTSRIALEKHLAELEAASFLVDARPYRGRPHSLRVEVQPITFKNGRLLHAKILLCVYEEAVRLIVGSANLTEPGYRRNREIVAVLTASAKKPRDAALILQAISGFGELLSDRRTDSTDSLCSLATQQLKKWQSNGISDSQWFAWGGGVNPLWKQVVSRWPQNEPIHRITIVSPFWSEEQNTGGPVTRLIAELKTSNSLASDVELHLLTEAAPDKQTAYKPRLPDSFREFDASRMGVNAFAIAIDPRVPPSDMNMGVGFVGTRALHAKVVLFEGHGRSLAYLGSANFTNRGWGFLPQVNSANIEAGIILLNDSKSVLQGLIPKTIGDRVPLSGAAAGKLVSPEPSPDELPWPVFLTNIFLALKKDSNELLEFVLSVDQTAVAGNFEIAFLSSESNTEILFRWSVGDANMPEYRIGLTESDLAKLLKSQEVHVRWWDFEPGRSFPINVSAEARPNLPISPLSGHPEEQNLIAYYQGKITWEDLFPDPGEGDDSDSSQQNSHNDEQTVDTSRIQSYIVREFVEAIKGINDDLKAAALSSKACMRLALIGSISPVALARQVCSAVASGQRSPTAAGFQLVEILGCLASARVIESSKAFRKDWLALVDEAAEVVAKLIDDLQQRHPNDLSVAFKRYSRAIRRHYQVEK